MQKFKLVFFKAIFFHETECKSSKLSSPLWRKGITPHKRDRCAKCIVSHLEVHRHQQPGRAPPPGNRKRNHFITFQSGLPAYHREPPWKSVTEEDWFREWGVCVCVCGFPGQKLIASWARPAGIECQKVSWSCIGMGSAVCKLKLMEQLVFLKFNWSFP